MNNTIQMYDAQADSIKIEDIVSNKNNRIVLDRIKRNSEDDDYNQELFLQNQHDEQGEDCIDYVPEGAHDMGWLGYFVGKNEQLKELYIRDFTPTSGASVTEVLKPFIRGVTNNRSINKLDFYRMDLLGGRIFSMMGPFFEKFPSLSNLAIYECNLGDDGWRLLALAIGSSKAKSLQKVTLTDCNISDQGLVDIITALSMHPKLQHIELIGNRMSTKGCTTLATLLRCSCTELESLDLDNNVINDEGIDALVPVLKKCDHLQSLSLENNSITTKGWQHLATILEAPNCSSLTTLYTAGVNVDDDAVTAFTSALVNNRTLTTLGLSRNPSITDEGWKIFSKLLCDTSSINSTYLSNHTLAYLGLMPPRASPLRPLLKLNQKYEGKKELAMIKILQYHNDFDMIPFFEWEFKVLPLMINWFERASSITSMPENFDANIGPRKLSSIYQFVRGMPLLYVEAQLRKQLRDIKLKETHLDEEHRQMEKRQLELRHQQLVLDMQLQEFAQRKKSVGDEKKSIIEKLGR